MKKLATEVKALLFDLDGTLIDSVDELTFCINEAFSRLNLSALTAHEVSRFVGKGARVLVERALLYRLGTMPDKALVDQTFQLYTRSMLDNIGQHTRIYPEVLDALETLKKSYRLGLVTNKPRAVTEALLTVIGLAPFFEILVCGDDTAHPKPAPDMLYLAMSELGVQPSECIMIGDSLNDALCAQAAGVLPILVATGYNEGVPISQWAKTSSPETRVYDNMSGVVSFLLTERC